MNARHVAVKIGTGVVGTGQKEFDQRVAVLALEITDQSAGS